MISENHTSAYLRMRISRILNPKFSARFQIQLNFHFHSDDFGTFCILVSFKSPSLSPSAITGAQVTLQITATIINFSNF